MKFCALFYVACFTFVFPAMAERSSLLNSDPSVLYVKDDLGKKVVFVVAKDCKIYSSKTGGRQLGVYSAGTKVELLAMTDKVYRVKGEATHGLVPGWVDPRYMLSKDAEFVENLKALYKRQMMVRELISQNAVAIGMTIDEVAKSLGEPVKKSSKTTKNGRTGRWEFIEYNEERNFNYVRDPRTGQVFKQFSHTTVEESAKVVVDFEDDVVIAIEETEDNGPGKVKIITPPIVLL